MKASGTRCPLRPPLPRRARRRCLIPRITLHSKALEPLSRTEATLFPHLGTILTGVNAS